jgi:predicted transcriptional regulator
MLTGDKPEGQILREFVDSQNVNVTKLAKALGITRQSFYQYYDSTVLNTDTKQKIEGTPWKANIYSRIILHRKKKDA